MYEMTFRGYFVSDVLTIEALVDVTEGMVARNVDHLENTI